MQAICTVAVVVATLCRILLLRFSALDQLLIKMCAGNVFLSFLFVSFRFLFSYLKLLQHSANSFCFLSHRLCVEKERIKQNTTDNGEHSGNTAAKEIHTAPKALHPTPMRIQELKSQKRRNRGAFFKEKDQLKKKKKGKGSTVHRSNEERKNGIRKNLAKFQQRSSAPSADQESQ